MAIHIAAQATPAVDNTCTTLIEFLLDETGSMSDHKAQTMAGFNAFLNEQRSQPGTCLFTLTKFASGGLKTPYTDLAIGMAPAIAANTFVPYGGTNLRDAIVERAHALEDRLASFTGRVNVIFVVLTDGDDTCSRIGVRQVRDTLKARSADGWTCLYRGPKGTGLQTASALGFEDENADEFEASEIETVMADLSRKATAHRVAA